jgi:hypothetical protein
LETCRLGLNFLLTAACDNDVGTSRAKVGAHGATEASGTAGHYYGFILQRKIRHELLLQLMFGWLRLACS